MSPLPQTWRSEAFAEDLIGDACCADHAQAWPAAPALAPLAGHAAAERANARLHRRLMLMTPLFVMLLSIAFAVIPPLA